MQFGWNLFPDQDLLVKSKYWYMFGPQLKEYSSHQVSTIFPRTLQVIFERQSQQGFLGIAVIRHWLRLAAKVGFTVLVRTLLQNPLHSDRLDRASKSEVSAYSLQCMLTPTFTGHGLMVQPGACTMMKSCPTVSLYCQLQTTVLQYEC